VANLESLFFPVIELLRKYTGPFANEKCRREMEESMFYTVEVVQLPSGARDWVCPHFYIRVVSDIVQGYLFASNREGSRIFTPRRRYGDCFFLSSGSSY
jgi:hypothetical protein